MNKLKDFNRVLGYSNGIINQHFTADESIINRVTNETILSPEQTASFSQAVNALHDDESHWIDEYRTGARYSIAVFEATQPFDEKYAAMKESILTPSKSYDQLCPTDIACNQSITLLDTTPTTEDTSIQSALPYNSASIARNR